MTIQYAENTEINAGLQPDSRRDRGDRIDLVDQLLDLIRQLEVTESGIDDLQTYYWKTISRKTAFHGIAGKLFTMKNNGLQLLVSWSNDCQYPLQLFLFDNGYIVGRIYTFKQSKASKLRLNLLSLDMLREDIKDSILNYAKHYSGIKYALEATKFSKHFRYYRDTCLAIVKSFDI